MMRVKPSLLFRDGLDLWLGETFPKGVGSRPQSQFTPLCPFRSSMRTLERASGFMAQIAAGQTIAGDVGQIVGDLRSMALVEPGKMSLTPLGTRSLQTWNALLSGRQVSPDVAEVVRATALVRAALTLNDTDYVAMFKFWAELRKFQRGSFWWQDQYHQFFPAYFNHTDSRGFNPLRLTLRAAGTIGEADDWLELADAGGLVNGASLKGLIEQKIDGWRPGGPRAFMKGMEANRAAATGATHFYATTKEIWA